MQDFRLHWACITTNLLLLCKQVTGSSFPSFDEALSLEIPTLLTLPSVIRVLWGNLSPSTREAIVADPWTRSMSIKAMIDAVVDTVDTNQITHQVMMAMESIWETDPTCYAVLRRGLSPIRNADIIQDAVETVSTAFQVPPDDLDLSVQERYYNLFKRIS